jgi:hypothetical protein
MRNQLLMGVPMSALALSALAFAAVPASAQVQANPPVQVDPQAPRSQSDGGWDESRPADDDDYDGDVAVESGEADYDGYGYAANDQGGYRGFGFGIQITGGGSANEYGPYGYRDRGYGVYAEWGQRGGRRTSPLRAAFEFGRRDGYEAGFDAARYRRFEPMRHRYYRSTRGWDRRFGGRDAYDVNYRHGFRAGYEEGYRAGRRSRRW